MLREENSGTDLTASVGVQICHNIGTHLGNIFYGRNYCSNICSGGPNILQNMDLGVQILCDRSSPFLWGLWWPGSQSKGCGVKAMGWPGITSKAVGKSDTPLPTTLPA